ncbi:MAG: glycosyltransferase [Bacteroidetes bacterium]|nr:glycosyltransferase [Bacteroidota bacterium]
MKLSIIIVNYNVEHFLEQCLHSVLKASKNISSEVIIVDNSSVDGSVAMVKNKFPEVKLLANEKNVGFSRANNQGIKESKGEYILLLNPDTVVQEDTFEKTIKFMDEHQDAGALGVMMLDGKGNFLPESKRGLPTPSVAFYKVFGLSALFPKSKIFGKYHLGHLDKNKIHEVDVLAGAFMLIRKSVLDKIGLLDETFFMYGEDIDLSYRIILAGFKNYYFPETRIIHYKGESTKKSSVNYVLVFYNAMAIFAKKHFAKNQAKMFSLLIYFAIALRATMAIGKRFLKQLFVPMLDATILFAGLYFIKNYYEHNVKYVAYPEKLVLLAFGLYVFVWLFSVFLSGGYEKPIRLQKIARGIFWGTGIILITYALLPEEYRFSRALILIGTGWATIAMLATRMLFHLFGIESFMLEGSTSKRLAIAGSEEEYKRVFALLKESSIKTGLVGFVSIEHADDGNWQRTTEKQPEFFLGRFSQLQDIITIYKIDEVIFCSKNLSAVKIIDAMSAFVNMNIEFKIAPPESLSIIGSNSIDTAGDLYAIDINSVNKPSNRRKKRIIDVLFAMLFISLLPVLIFIIKNPIAFIENIFQVLLGFKTWVGEAQSSTLKGEIQPYPLVQGVAGIFSPADSLKANHISPEVVQRLNKIYAKDYQIWNDVNIILKGIGNKLIRYY